MDRRDDLSTITAAPRVFRFEGRDYLVPKLRPREMGEIQAFLKDRIPDPRIAAREAMRECKFEGLATRIWERAEEEAKSWPPSMKDQRAEAVLATAEGFALMTWLMLRRCGVDRSQAEALADRMEVEEFKRLLALASPEGLDDPKA